MDRPQSSEGRGRAQVAPLFLPTKESGKIPPRCALAKTASISSAGAIHRQFAKCYRDLARQIEGEQPLAPAPLSQR